MIIKSEKAFYIQLRAEREESSGDIDQRRASTVVRTDEPLSAFGANVGDCS